MADMEFGQTFAQKSGQAMTTALVEGGGVAIGFLGAGALGKLVENKMPYIAKNVVPTSSMTDKIVAWTANNAPKVGLWYLAYKYGPKKATNMTELMIIDAKKAVVASVVVDSLMRIGNSGAPGAGINLFGIQLMPGNEIPSSNPQLQASLQKVISENSTLRSQLNQALGKLASSPNPTPAYTTPPEPAGTEFGTMPTRGNPRFGTMPVDQTKTQKKFGQMRSGELTLDERVTVGAMHGFD